MTSRSTLGRSVATAVLWPFGVGLTSWHYMWRTTPLHRQERAGSQDADEAPPLPPGVRLDDVQRPEDGVGARYHRRYATRITGSNCSAQMLMGQVTDDLNQVAPSEFARFTRQGGDGRMAVGDDYLVRMPGPWNGPVRVVAMTSRSFRLATLRGHLEAGQIEFRAAEDGPDLVFTIESWASSGDRLSKLLYQHLRMAKEVQLHMWTSFLENVARLCRGRMVGGIDIVTRTFGEGSGQGERLFGDPGARRVLDALHDKALNFDLGSDPRRVNEQAMPENGWHVDHYRQVLPAEPPGPPCVGGSWEVATGLLRDYEFADPTIVRAVYYPDRPLTERDMLLEARFWCLRFRLGVRVGGVIDETREIEGQPVRVWGWNYRTLQGHLEMGQMDYEIWKWIDTGSVEFRISAFSRPAPVANPIVRLGFRAFGRREQVKFARHACVRMARLTAARLSVGRE